MKSAHVARGAVGRLAPGVARAGEPLLAPAEAPREQREGEQQERQRDQAERDQQARGRARVRAVEQRGGGGDGRRRVGDRRRRRDGRRRGGLGRRSGVVAGRRLGVGRRRGAAAAPAWSRAARSGPAARGWCCSLPVVPPAAPSPFSPGCVGESCSRQPRLPRSRARSAASTAGPERGRRLLDVGRDLLQRACDRRRPCGRRARSPRRSGSRHRPSAARARTPPRPRRAARSGARTPPRGPRSSGRAHPEGTDGLVLTLDRMKLLVTGGAGYIGSIVAAQLVAAGHDVAVLDSLYRGHAQAIPAGARHLDVDLNDAAATTAAVAEGFDGVLHFAALALVAESVWPRRSATTAATSSRPSTCSTPCARPASDGSCSPPPARSTASPRTCRCPRRADEPGQRLRQLEAGGRPHDLRRVPRARARRGVAALLQRGRRERRVRRGPPARDAPHPAGPPGRGRQARPRLGVRDGLPDPDGTAVRDYIHIEDLAEAHLLGLERATNAGEHAIYNLGNGTGFSVRQVIDAARAVTGREIQVKEEGRRPGRPSRAGGVVAEDPQRARLGPTQARDRDDDRRRLGVVRGAPGGLRRLRGPASAHQQEDQDDDGDDQRDDGDGSGVHGDLPAMI